MSTAREFKSTFHTPTISEASKKPGTKIGNETSGGCDPSELDGDRLSRIETAPKTKGG